MNWYIQWNRYISIISFSGATTGIYQGTIIVIKDSIYIKLEPAKYVLMVAHLLPNPKLLLKQLQVCGRHYNCQPYYYSTTLDSTTTRDVKFWGWQRLIQAKGHRVHSMSSRSPNQRPPRELDIDAETSQEESPTFIKNWSVKDQINPSFKSGSFSRGHWEVAQTHCWKIA